MGATDIATRVVDAFNQHDASALVELYDEQSVVRDPSYPEPLNGPADIRRDFSDFINAFPDLRNTITRLVGDSDTVAVEGEVEGTHQGTLPLPDGDVPATGRRVKMPYAVIMRADDGHVIEEHRYYDVAGLLRQLGLSS